jgi:hypothetical protein
MGAHHDNIRGSSGDGRGHGGARKNGFRRGLLGRTIRPFRDLIIIPSYDDGGLFGLPTIFDVHTDASCRFLRPPQDLGTTVLGALYFVAPQILFKL